MSYPWECPSDIFLFLAQHREYAATKLVQYSPAAYCRIPWAAITANILSVCEASADQP